MQVMSIAVFHILCYILFLVLNIDLDDLGFMNQGPSDEVIHTQREGSVGMVANSIEYRWHCHIGCMDNGEEQL